MTASRAAMTTFALIGLAALPACSMLGMHEPSMLSSSSSTPAPMARPELSPGMVKQVQTSLQQQGIYKGNIDGVWGGATQDAVKQYQSAHNMTASGQLDEATLRSLHVTSATANGTAGSAPGTATSPSMGNSGNMANPPAANPPPAGNSTTQ